MLHTPHSFKMVSLENVPIVEVNKDNLVQLWPAIVLAIKSSTFIALDTVSTPYLWSVNMICCGGSNTVEISQGAHLAFHWTLVTSSTIHSFLIFQMTQWNMSVSQCMFQLALLKTVFYFNMQCASDTILWLFQFIRLTSKNI
jgi:hypothetical protein